MAATDDLSYQTTIAIVFAVTIASIAIVLRLLARKLHQIPYGADDYMMVVGAILSMANSLVFVWTNKYGNGRHINTIEPHSLLLYWRTFFVSYQFYGAAITAIKLSVLLFYKRIFSTARFRKWIYGTGFLVCAWLLANNLTFAFQCSPVQKAWKLDIPGRCINPLTAVKAVQFFNVALDFLVVALPVPAIVQLQLSTTRKISLLAVFSLASLSLIIAIVRLSILFTEKLEDITYETTICSWTIIEPAIEVLSGCLPTMAPLVTLWPHAIHRFSSFSLPWIGSHHSKSEPSHDMQTSKETRTDSYRDSMRRSSASHELYYPQRKDSDCVPLDSIAVK